MMQRFFAVNQCSRNTLLSVISSGYHFHLTHLRFCTRYKVARKTNFDFQTIDNSCTINTLQYSWLITVVLVFLIINSFVSLLGMTSLILQDTVWRHFLISMDEKSLDEKSPNSQQCALELCMTSFLNM